MTNQTGETGYDHGFHLTRDLASRFFDKWYVSYCRLHRSKGDQCVHRWGSPMASFWQAILEGIPSIFRSIQQGALTKVKHYLRGNK